MSTLATSIQYSTWNLSYNNKTTGGNKGKINGK